MGSDLNQFVLATDPTDATLARRAAVHVADHIGAKHPHPLDEYMPRIAGAVLAKDPAIAAGAAGDPRRTRHPTRPDPEDAVIAGLFIAVAAVALLLASAREDRRNRNTREGQ